MPPASPRKRDRRAMPTGPGPRSRWRSPATERGGTVERYVSRGRGGVVSSVLSEDRLPACPGVRDRLAACPTKNSGNTDEFLQVEHRVGQVLPYLFALQ